MALEDAVYSVNNRAAIVRLRQGERYLGCHNGVIWLSDGCRILAQDIQRGEQVVVASGLSWLPSWSVSREGDVYVAFVTGNQAVIKRFKSGIPTSGEERRLSEPLRLTFADSDDGCLVVGQHAVLKWSVGQDDLLEYAVDGSKIVTDAVFSSNGYTLYRLADEGRRDCGLHMVDLESRATLEDCQRLNGVNLMNWMSLGTRGVFAQGEQDLDAWDVDGHMARVPIACVIDSGGTDEQLDGPVAPRIKLERSKHGKMGAYILMIDNREFSDEVSYQVARSCATTIQAVRIRAPGYSYDKNWSGEIILSFERPFRGESFDLIARMHYVNVASLSEPFAQGSGRAKLRFESVHAEIVERAFELDEPGVSIMGPRPTRVAVALPRGSDAAVEVREFGLSSSEEEFGAEDALEAGVYEACRLAGMPLDDFAAVEDATRHCARFEVSGTVERFSVRRTSPPGRLMARSMPSHATFVWQSVALLLARR